MNRDDIVRMAREAGWTGPEENVTYVAMLERFANLVAAAEREACEAVFNERMLASMKFNAEVRAFDAAIKAEREACAKILDEMAAKDRLSNYFQVAAIAIRERGAP